MAKRTPPAKPITEDEAAYGGGAVTSQSEAEATTPGEAITSSQPTRRNLGAVVSDSGTPYVSSSVEYPFFWGDRAVPKEIDQAERDFGLDIYDKMATEPILAAAVRAFKYSVLSDGLTIKPSHPEPKTTSTPEEKADFEKANEIAEYIRLVFKRLEWKDRPILETLNNALDCFFKGHKLIEQTADIIERGPFKGNLGLASFRAKPRENYAFVVETGTNSFRGVIAKVPGGAISLRTGLVFDSSLIGNTIAPEKLTFFTLDDRDGDPRGKSFFRDVYDPWYRKQQVKIEHLKALMRFAGGMISVIGPEEAKSVTYANPVTGKPDTLTNCLVSAASKMSNGHAAVFPFGSQVDVHMPTAQTSAFDEAFKMLDREMVTSLLLTARAMLEAAHGSKADSDSAQDLFDELKMFGRERVCSRLNRLIRWLVLCSYDEETADKYSPEATMQRTSRPDFSANATSLAALKASGWPMTTEQIDYYNTEVLGAPSGVQEEEPVAPEAGGELGVDPAGFPAGTVRTEARPSGSAKDQPATEKQDSGKSQAAFGRRLSAIDAGRSAAASKHRGRSHERQDRRRRVGGAI